MTLWRPPITRRRLVVLSLGFALIAVACRALYWPVYGLFTSEPFLGGRPASYYARPCGYRYFVIDRSFGGTSSFLSAKLWARQHLPAFVTDFACPSPPFELGGPPFPDDPLPVIRFLLKGEDLEVRWFGVAGIQKLAVEQGRHAVEELRGLLKDPDPHLRAAALILLQRCGADAEAALPDIWPLLQDDVRVGSPTVSWYASEAESTIRSAVESKHGRVITR